jgi:predicted extracellular nuclease
MSKWIFPYLLTSTLLSHVIVFPGYSQDVNQTPLRIMFYNVENLFDIYDDTLTDDNEFLPDGTRRWNMSRYNQKINSVHKVIIAAGEWDPPQIVAFCEIENRKVLEDLIGNTYLSKFDYGIIHEDSPDRRGIDVCLIYRKKILKIIHFSYWIPEKIKPEDFNSRSVLYAKLLSGSDTIHLIVNHWPSRRGGVLAGEDFRLNISQMIREKVDSIMEKNPADAKILIIGDFNCTPADQAIWSMTRSDEESKSLINLSESLDAQNSGTYRYMGTWEMIDQVIVSQGLLKSNKGFRTSAGWLKIFKPEFILTRDGKYPGFTPYSTYRGFKYQGGFSDHLPVFLDLIFQQAGQ